MQFCFHSRSGDKDTNTAAGLRARDEALDLQGFIIIIIKVHARI